MRLIAHLSVIHSCLDKKFENHWKRTWFGCRENTSRNVSETCTSHLQVYKWQIGVKAEKDQIHLRIQLLFRLKNKNKIRVAKMFRPVFGWWSYHYKRSRVNMKCIRSGERKWWTKEDKYITWECIFLQTVHFSLIVTSK